MDSKEPKLKSAKEVEQVAAACDNTPSKKKKVASDRSSAANMSQSCQALLTGANEEINLLFSMFAQVMSKKAAVDETLVVELEDILKEAGALESHLRQRKERLRHSLAAISNQLQG